MIAVYIVTKNVTVEQHTEPGAIGSVRPAHLKAL